MGKVYKKAPIGELDVLSELYTVKEPTAVAAFVEAHPFLGSLLLETRPMIDRYFPSAPVVLKVVTDPEVPDQRELVAAVAPQVPPAETVASLLQFLDDWGLDAQARGRNRLTVTVEYQ